MEGAGMNGEGSPTDIGLGLRDRSTMFGGLLNCLCYL